MCGILAVIGSKNIELPKNKPQSSPIGPDERDSVLVSTYPEEQYSVMSDYRLWT